MGAWIETQIQANESIATSKSHPIWVRGLKHNNRDNNAYHLSSHPIWVRGLKRNHLLK